MKKELWRAYFSVATAVSLSTLWFDPLLVGIAVAVYAVLRCVEEWVRIVYYNVAGEEL